ncbi:PaaI family thioesterase [Sphingobium sp.]|uniref:PaaI family thioesterase n=1 Tax=Sphingobium sp. TaxID=1912891 RepID=UPI0028BE6634|nr:PaaI family thioesterase [Sphingobium sp.]
MTDTPPGFLLIDALDDVMGAFAPIHAKKEEDQITFGFRVGAKHCNPAGNCHGGTWATLADILMGMNIGCVTGKTGPTISLSIDFLGPAREGQWVEGRAKVLRWTPNLGFAECSFTADGEPALRANAVFRRKVPPYRSFEALISAAGEA